MDLFSIQVKRFLEDLTMEINCTPTGNRRNMLTDAQIMLMRIQDFDEETQKLVKEFTS